MFPNYNIYSVPLLILYVLGIIFCIVIYIKYRKSKHISDLLLVLIMAVHTYHRTTYTVGFMGWYDTFPNTKINYFLLDLTLGFGPLIYLYVRSITNQQTRLSKRDWLHFIPVLLFIIYRLIIFLYDVNQPGFEDVQNGRLFQLVNMNYGSFIAGLLGNISQIIYLFLSIFLFLNVTIGEWEKIPHL